MKAKLVRESLFNDFRERRNQMKDQMKDLGLSSRDLMKLSRMKEDERSEFLDRTADEKFQQKRQASQDKFNAILDRVQQDEELSSLVDELSKFPSGGTPDMYLKGKTLRAGLTPRNIIKKSELPRFNDMQSARKPLIVAVKDRLSVLLDQNPGERRYLERIYKELTTSY